MDQFPFITALQERDGKKKAAAAAANDKKVGEPSKKHGQEDSATVQKKPGKETIMGKMGKKFDKYVENATEHHEDRGMRMGRNWLYSEWDL